MTVFRLIAAGLVHHRRMHLAVGLGVMAGTAVLVGALVVGDSVRGSLRHLTLDRLGKIDEVLLADRFFREELAEELAAEPEFRRDFSAAAPAILLDGSLENPDPRNPARVNRVAVIGCDARFWAQGTGGPPQAPGAGEVVLNAPLASELNAAIGDEVLVRLPEPGQIPADSPLGRKTETVRSRRLVVRGVIPAEGLGRFGLRPSQQLPRNAYVAVETLQAVLAQRGKVNAILVSGRERGEEPAAAANGVLNRLLRPALEDFGLRVQETPRGYLQVTSDRMILSPAAEAAVTQAVAGRSVDRKAAAPTQSPIQPALTYLANTIAAGGREIPYSTVTAIDFRAKPPLGPFQTRDGKTIPPLADGEIALNSWGAERLGVAPGQMVRVTFFEPESTHGQIRERTVELRLAAVVERSGAAADRNLTPAVPGVTDQLSMGNWKAPFPFVRSRIHQEDEEYWKQYRATPKAFVSLATGRRLWGSRFGNATSLRIPPGAGLTVKTLAARLHPDPAAMGFQFRPVKRQGLEASSGTTPFGILFLGFSFFIIASAVMLVGLLFRLGIDQRATEVGILLAVGFRRRRVARVFAGEAIAVAAVGGLAGAAAGIGYAWLMLAGLRTWWLAAVSTPFLRLHWTWTSVVAGYASGAGVSLLGIAWALWQMRRASVRRLLAGQAGESAIARRRSRWMRVAGWMVLASAVALGAVAARLGGEAQAGAFFGSGSLVLAACLVLLWTRLRTGDTATLAATRRLALARLALRNAARNPGRSTLSIGLVAAAAFLIVSISAFRIDPTGRLPVLDSGDGGFALVGQSDQPIYQDLNTRAGREELGFPPADEKRLPSCAILSLRVQPGDDASCLNLYQPSQPRVLGVPKSMIARGGFAWAAASDGDRENPWRLLDKDLGRTAAGRPIIPVVIDMNTAMYSLHLWQGVGQRYELPDGRGGTLTLEVVGLLQNSIFQGDLLIGEEAFARCFPEVSGDRFFLVDAAPEHTREVRQALERNLGDFGFAAETAGDRLAGFLAVQNTYLSTFQSLGGLGLLLGTFGLATVQLRNVFERRGELALLRATGFRRRQLARMVLLENALLLVGGLGIGVLAAGVAVGPHLGGRGASIPWGWLTATLGAVLAVGLAAGLAAVRATLRAPLVAALRGE
jgi:putative ABC transport system permease protein